MSIVDMFYYTRQETLKLLLFFTIENKKNIFNIIYGNDMIFVKNKEGIVKFFIFVVLLFCSYNGYVLAYENDNYLQLETASNETDTNINKQIYLLNSNKNLTEQEKQQLKNSSVNVENTNSSNERTKIMNDVATKNNEYIKQYELEQKQLLEQERRKEENLIKDREKLDKQAKELEQKQKQIEQQQQQLKIENADLKEAKIKNDKTTQQLQQQKQELLMKEANVEQQKAKIENDAKDMKEQITQIQEQLEKTLQKSEENNKLLQKQMEQNKADTEKTLTDIQKKQEKTLTEIQRQQEQNRDNTEKTLSKIQEQQGKHLEQNEEIKNELKKIKILNRDGVSKSTNSGRFYNNYSNTVNPTNIDVLNKINSNLTYSNQNKKETGSVVITKGGWSNKDLIEESKIGFSVKKQSKKIEGMESVVGENSSKIKQLKELAYKASETKNYEVALRYYKQLVMLNKQDNYSKLSLATTYHLLGQYRQAKPLYIELLDVYPNNEQLASNLMSIVIQETPYEAVYLVPSFADKYYDSYLIQAQASVAFSKVGKYDKAIEYLQRAMALNQDNIDYKYNLAVLYDKNKNYDDAVKLYKDVMSQDPTNYSRNNKIKKRLSKLD